ncbi:hypothetical protein GPK34_04180 [Secundilactobacillus kimchicus]|uniref:bacteriocin immunity protein n=1 Tax=Secundilactobacillus kimchicus TaxID=528209 RepID=UPI001C033219|nr:bacteriocin immunity protein [Secundilactobacillus kimchicus]MBT9671230.1 hypothetical protein [Secundilactobacillus kimchicus]
MYRSIDNEPIRQVLTRAYQRLVDGADVSDLTAHAASAVNYLRLSRHLTFTASQEDLWRQLRDQGNAEVLYHDVKNNLLDSSER